MQRAQQDNSKKTRNRIERFVDRHGHVITLFVLSLASSTNLIHANEPLDFQRDIRPILSEHCLQCHGPDEEVRQDDLRLDLRESAMSEGNSGQFAIVPGNADSSELLRRVVTNDPELVMPPPDENNPLSPEQVVLLRKWINEGAPYAKHWAFVAPRHLPVPKIDGDRKSQPTNIIRTPVDAFVIDRLRRDGLNMSPPAAHDVLCRRLYLDAIGLPPTPMQMDKFLTAAKEDFSTAVETLIEELLRSEQFGEKWARHWLDVARYADTNGYEKDLRRDQWAWRDWVIQAINNDMPYDQFIIEQIAGDLLPNRTQGQLVATGFLRNGMINEEGAILPEQFRMEGLFDHMDCLGKAVLGLSLQCGQCHNHKFDPLSQDEYYGMFSFLNDTYESRSWVYSPQQLLQIAEIEAAVRKLEQEKAANGLTLQEASQNPFYQPKFAEWEREQRATAAGWKIIDTLEQVWVGGVNHPDELPDHSIMVLGHPSVTGKMYVRGQPPLDGVTGLRLEALTHHDLPFGGPGRSERGTFAVTELRVEAKQPGSDSWVALPLTNASSDFSESEQFLIEKEDKKEEDGKEVERRRVGPVEFLIDGKATTAWRADRGPGLRHTDSVAVVQFAEPLHLPEGTQLKVLLEFNHSPPGDGRFNTMLGRMRFALSYAPGPAATDYHHAATLALQKPAAQRSIAEQTAVLTAWWQTVPELAPIQEKIHSLQRQHPEATTSVLTLLAREPSHQRRTRVLDRGVWDQPQHEVAPHFPAFLHSPPVEQGEDAANSPEADLSKNSGVRTNRPTRLDFARWLADRRSPLTARVQVNRLWQAIFGTGLVQTAEDFGSRAPQPEHFQLLEWLAVDFMNQGWSNKSLIRNILNSATYQQTSRLTAELLEVDPQNRLLARGPRFRVEAEMVRDIALSVSDLLSHQVGGPSIFPPLPESVLKSNFYRPAYWLPSQGPQRYRRAIYIFRKRSMPDPTLASFDAPNADLACARRTRSNTPLSALVSLNEPIFVEAARAMALRVLREGGPNDQQRTDFAFRLCTGRKPKSAERSEILTLLKLQRQRLADGWLSINEVATGDPEQVPSVPPDATPQDAAAWTITARVLLNLDETLSKN
ncbi:MAG: hypothetical protein CMJ81_18330 [Planctomycetaceae bacterium]|nr:hypothetical protein [Planctomycetaceae bacterium]MBP61935.1 hypothetical protein [Planctomycetaceae bacterium]